MEINSKEIWPKNQEEQLINALYGSCLVSITDSKGIIINVNNKFCKTSGYDEQELLGQNHRILKSGKLPDNIYKDLWETISSKKIWSGELCNRRKDGSFYWIRTSIVPFIDNRGSIEKYVEIGFDITENKESEKALRSMKNRFSNVFNSANDAILIVDIKTRKIININNKVNEMFGYTKYELMGESNYKLYPKKNIGFIKKRGEHMIANNNVIFETQLLHKDGSLIDVEINSKVFNDGSQAEFQSVVRDITDKKRKELIIKRSEERFRLIFDTAPNAFFICDSNGKILNCNNTSEKLSGYKKKDLINKNITETDLISITDIDYFTSALKIPSKKPRRFEFKITPKTGKKIDVEIISHHVFIDGQKLVLNIVHDITKLKTMHDKLQKKSSELELFLYRVGHDLRAPFTSLEGLLDLIKLEPHNENTLELLNMFESTLNSGKVLIDNLASSSSMINKSIKNVQVDFNKIIKQTLINLKHIEGFKNINFNINIPKEFKFYSNPQMLNSIMQNLLQNAIKYHRPPSDSHTPFIILNALNTKQGIKISIKDNGIGINQNEIDKVFDLYYRSNSTIDGTGLGLYITKGAVDQLKGTIKVTSSINKETQFDITFPNLSKT